MKSFVNRGLRLEYIDKGEGRPLIFLHGLGGSAGAMESIYEPIEGLRFISLTQQGHGGSEADWSRFGFEALADDVIALLDELKIEKAAFAGVSMGAAVSLNAAVRYPARVERLLLIRNAWTEKPMSRRVIRAYADLGRCLERGGVEEFYKTEGWQTVREPSAYTRNTFLNTFSQPDNVRNWQKYLLLPSDSPVKAAEQIASVGCPCTVLANRHDLCHPYEYGEYIHSLIKGSRFYELPDKDSDSAGHNRLLNEHLKNWII